MSRFILPLLFLVTWVVVTNAARKPDPKASGSPQFPLGTFPPYNFLINKNYVDWREAKNQCRLLGADWHLVSIENQDKQAALIDFLESQGERINEFWTSGKFNVMSNRFEWDHSGQQIPYWAPWFPGTVPLPFDSTRVSFALSPGNRYWKQVGDTERKQGVCEFR